MSAEELQAESTIELQLPPPGVGLRRLEVPSGSGASIRIVLKPETWPAGPDGPATCSLSAEGPSFMTATIVKTDGSIWTASLDQSALQSMAQKLNAGLDFDYVATLILSVKGSGDEDSLRTTSADIEGRMSVLVNGTAVGTIRWGYDLGVLALMEGCVS